MTRFDAATPTERRKLIADAIVAHRKRDSAFMTLEAEPTPAERDAMDALEEASPDIDDEQLPDAAPSVPWVQFADRTFNLDCTDEELAALKSLLSEFPECRIEQLDQPTDADGTNVRITARADPNRLAMFADRVFRDVYGRDEEYRVWAVEI